ncbi:Crp/Fnr family transcriptional regulator [Mucilaginibacter sp. SMC90]|uniref:Crp/Fnr family transcriptional regulator n=1 Tax=Mucilaginibacter sp. SMC90 TaxID=2929803 RepID=UPI001FB272C6|nr:Crp/Fnr family transcriptional regulator [Mucilaginibacter sp. SMC90]UOE51379.1 Crp/Fnr family transcriptional regulator [Mucilaginibacter sp. SMC90]
MVDFNYEKQWEMILPIFAPMNNSALKEAIDGFITLSGEDYDLLVSCASRREISKKERLLNEGQLCQALYFVENGYLRTWYNKDGISINADFTFENNFTSVIKSFRDGLPSNLNIETSDEAVIWIINLNSIREHIAVKPQLARFIKKVAISILLTAESHHELLKFHTPMERYHFIEKNNPELLQRISLSQISSYLGIARETLSRIRSRNGQ